MWPANVSWTSGWNATPDPRVEAMVATAMPMLRRYVFVPPAPPAHYGILKDAWERYHLPVAVTEAHLGCTRDEQLRWLMEVWIAARCLRHQGADIRAVTAWSLLGAFDWDCLVTQRNGHYEPGAFDVRGPVPRPTAIAHCLRALATRRIYFHPVLAGDGWWRRPQRLLYPPVRPHGGKIKTGVNTAFSSATKEVEVQPILMSGARPEHWDRRLGGSVRCAAWLADRSPVTKWTLSIRQRFARYWRR